MQPLVQVLVVIPHHELRSSFRAGIKIFLLVICLQVWKVIGKETESLSLLIKEKADKMCVNVLDKVQQIISEKKMLKRIYQDERNRLENECCKVNNSFIEAKNNVIARQTLSGDAKY